MKTRRTDIAEQIKQLSKIVEWTQYHWTGKQNSSQAGQSLVGYR